MGKPIILKVPVVPRLTYSLCRNCPKYINIRDLEPHPNTSPEVVYNRLQLSDDEHLPEELVEFILAADTAFVGTTYKPKPEDEAKFPSHVGHNVRSALPGFVRVKPSDRRTVVLPDYSGEELVKRSD